MQRGVAPRSLELTPEASERLRFVQDDVNASIRYAPDPPGRDRWGVPAWRRVRWLTRSVPGRLDWERARHPVTLEGLSRRVT